MAVVGYATTHNWDTETQHQKLRRLQIESLELDIQKQKEALK